MPHIEGGLTIQEYGEMLTSHEKAALVINQVYIQVTKHHWVHYHATRSAPLMTQIFCCSQSLKRAGKRITVLEVYAPWCRKCLKMSREVFKACKKYKDEVELCPLQTGRCGSRCGGKS